MVYVSQLNVGNVFLNDNGVKYMFIESYAVPGDRCLS